MGKTALLQFLRLIQIRAPCAQQGQLAADGGDEGHIQLGNEGMFLLVALVEDIAPRGADDGVPPRMVGGIHIPRGGTAYGEALLVHGPLTEEKLPMGGASGHIEGGGDDDYLCAAEGYQAAQLGEAEIKAHAHAHCAPRRIKRGHIAACGQRVRLEKPLTALHINVEQVGLTVAGDAVARGVKHVAGVVDVAAFQFGHGAAYEVDALFAGKGGEGLIDRAAPLLAIVAETGGIVGTAEHLGEDGHVHLARLADSLAGAVEVGGLIPRDGHLNEGKG